MRPHKHHSFSRLSTFSEICERRYALDALDPEPFSSPAIERGSHVHAAVEAYCRARIAGSDDPVGAAQRANANRTLPGRAKYALSQEAIDDYLVRLEPALSQIAPTAAEKWFRDCAGLPIVGKIDILGRRAGDDVVVDLKTTSNPARILGEGEALRSLQLQIYALAAGVRTAGFIFVMPVGRPVEVFVTFSEEQLEISKNWLRAELDVVDSRWKGDGLEAFSLARRGHPLCSEKWCRHWKNCIGGVE